MVDRLVNSEINSDRIAVVENAFGLSGIPLNLPGRVLVGEGILTKMCRKKLKPRQFFLFNDILVYGNIVITINKKKKFSRQRIIPLEQLKLENLVDDNNLVNGWLMKTPTKSFAVYAASPIEKLEWMDHLQKCIQDLLRRTGKQPTNEHAAVWVPDSDANICMHCHKNQFTVLNRRHHCRNCGSVICGSCSKNKFMIPSQSTKPVRVCDSCYYKLGKGRTGVFSPTSSLPEQEAENYEQAKEIVAEPVDKDGTGNIATINNDSNISSSNANNKLHESNTESSDSEEDKTDDDEAAGEVEVSPGKPKFYNMSEMTSELEKIEVKSETEVKIVN